MRRIFLVLVVVVGAAGCTLDVDVDAPLQVGPSACEFLVNFAAEPDPGYTPDDTCDGYAVTDDTCRTECEAQGQCNADYYCTQGTCEAKIIDGACDTDEECVSGLCACEMCADPNKLEDLLVSTFSVEADVYDAQ